MAEFKLPPMASSVGLGRVDSHSVVWAMPPSGDPRAPMTMGERDMKSPASGGPRSLFSSRGAGQGLRDERATRGCSTRSGRLDVRVVAEAVVKVPGPLDLAELGESFRAKRRHDTGRRLVDLRIVEVAAT